VSDNLHALTYGISGLEFAYTVILAAILTGLARARASWEKYLLSPLVAAPVLLLAGIVIALTSAPLRIIGIRNNGLIQLVFGAAVILVTGYVAGRALARNKPSSNPEHRRGAMVTATRPNEPVQSARQRWNGASNPSTAITLAGIPIPLEDETKHFKLIGTTGTGKSTAIREILRGALARGDRAIIADADAGYLSRFYDPARGDMILNPFDGDAHKWDLFAEISNDYDIDQLARSLIPDSGDPDRTWCEYARTFFAAVLRQSIRAGNRNDRELFRLLTTADEEELRMMLEGTAAGPFLRVGNEKMFGSLRSIASSAVKALEYTTLQQAPPLSVRQWVRQGTTTKSGSTGGVLFLPYTAGQIATLRCVISAWMRLAIFEAMDHSEADQHLWFVVDEVDALGEIDGLKDALARLRKFGGRCVLGLQSIAQMSGTYGKAAADTIVENCGNTCILRCSASEQGGTSEFASKLIGQREVLHTTQSKTRGPLRWLPSTTTSQHLKIEPAVMASEIERLPDLSGFLKLASVPDWQLVRLTPLNEPQVPRPARTVSTQTPPADTTVPNRADSPGVQAPAPAARSPRKSRGDQGQTEAQKRAPKRRVKAPTEPNPGGSALDPGNGPVQQ